MKTQGLTTITGWKSSPKDLYHIWNTLNRVRPVKPPSYPQCTYIWSLVCTHLSRGMTGQKKKKIEIWNTKIVKEGAILLRFEKPLLLFFSYPPLAFRLSRNISLQLLCLAQNAQMFSTTGFSQRSVHWVSGQFFCGSRPSWAPPQGPNWRLKNTCTIWTKRCGAPHTRVIDMTSVHYIWNHCPSLAP